MEASSGGKVMPEGTISMVGLKRLPPANALPGISFVKSSSPSSVTARTAASDPLGWNTSISPVVSNKSNWADRL